MSLNQFSELKLAEFIPSELHYKFKGERYENFKKDVIALILGQRVDVFNDGRGRDGAWAPTKNHSDPSHKPLNDTGVLRNSFTDLGGKGSEYKEEFIGEDEVGIKTNVEYAAIHNYGGTISHPGTSNGFGKGIVISAHDIYIEARPFDEFTDEHIAEINELTEAYINE